MVTLLDLKSRGCGFQSCFDYKTGVVSQRTIAQLLSHACKNQKVWQMGFLTTLCSFALFVPSFGLIGPEKTHWGSDQLRYIYCHFFMLQYRR